MDVLVIGGTGFVSGAVVAEALAQGHRVSVVTRGSANRSAPPPGVEMLTANRSDAAAMAAILGGRRFDLVVDCILFKPEDAKAIVEVLRGRVGRYVYISTDFVYGGEPRLYPLSEDSPRESLNPYGRDKAACEDIFTAAFAGEGFPAIGLRPPHILGSGSLLGTGSLQGRDAWLPYRLRNHHTIFLLDGGRWLIQPVHKTDIARVAVGIEAVGQIFNMAGPDCVTTLRYYELCAEVLGVAEPLRVVSLPVESYLTAFPHQKAFAQNRSYSLKKLESVGFVPQISLREALADTVAGLLVKGDPEGEPPADEKERVAIVQEHLGAIAGRFAPNA